MVFKFGLTAVALLLAPSAVFANASAVLPLVSHRAAYELSLVDPSSPPASTAQSPIAATGLIAYEFRGSACEGYTSNFRQMTRMERGEGEPLSMDVSAMSFEDPDGKSMRFKVDSQGAQPSPPVAGTATREAGDDMRIELTKPAPKAIDFGHNVLFPTQHVERLIEAAKKGGGVMQARVYDGSDTGAKIYDTMAVIGKEATKPSDDAQSAAELKGVRRWPVVVSYFDEFLQGFVAGIHPFLRSLRKRRVGHPEARLWDLCVARAPSQARDPAGDRLREIMCAGDFLRLRRSSAARRTSLAPVRSPPACSRPRRRT